MRIGLSLSASPAGALATAVTGTPRFLAPPSSTARAAALAGIQMALVSALSQYTSAPALSRRLIITNELLMRWLIIYPAGDDGPETVAAGGGRRPVILANGPSNPSRMRSNLTPICMASVQPVMS